MGMKATLIAIGPFKDDLIPHLDYGPWDYKGVKDGDRVVTTIVTCRTADASRELAAALGSEPLGLGNHVFTGLTREQHRGLMRFALKGEGARAADCDVEAIDILGRLRTWTFVYQPNA